MEHRQGVSIVDPYSVQSRVLISHSSSILIALHMYIKCLKYALPYITWNGTIYRIQKGKNHNLDCVLHFLNVLFIELAVYCNHLIKNIPG